jgi:hypothetical protein
MLHRGRRWLEKRPAAFVFPWSFCIKKKRKMNNKNHDPEQGKDWVQVKAAAEKLLQSL